VQPGLTPSGPGAALLRGFRARSSGDRASRPSAGRGDVIVLTVCEAVGSAILRHTPCGATELGREMKEISENVVDELDSHAAKHASETARRRCARCHGRVRGSTARVAYDRPGGRARYGHCLAGRPRRGGRDGYRVDRARQRRPLGCHAYAARRLARRRPQLHAPRSDRPAAFLARTARPVRSRHTVTTPSSTSDAACGIRALR
jgi:hypothetical protein